MNSTVLSIFDRTATFASSQGSFPPTLVFQTVKVRRETPIFCCIGQKSPANHCLAANEKTPP